MINWKEYLAKAIGLSMNKLSEAQPEHCPHYGKKEQARIYREVNNCGRRTIIRENTR